MNKILEIDEYLKTGERQELGTHHFTAEKIIRFAKKFDPQPFHLDLEAGKASFLGGLCASGWHSTSVWMRLQRDFSEQQLQIQLQNNIEPLEFGPSPGFENMKFLKPVFANDIISYYSTVISTRQSASRKEWHIATSEQFAHNEAGSPVLSFQSSFFFRLPNSHSPA